MEYLIFKTLAFAVTASFLIYWNFFRKKNVPKKKNVNPVELEDGRYALEKPDNKYMAGVESEEIQINPEIKEDVQEITARPPDPKGTPTKRPV
jgi:hypothetical protein